LQSSGADKLELKTSFEKEKKELEQKLFVVKHELLKLASGVLPLGLVQHVAIKAEKQALLEKNYRIFNDAESLLQKQKEQLLNMLSDKVDSIELSDLKMKFDEAQIIEKEKHTVDCYINTDPLYFFDLNSRIHQDKNSAVNLLLVKKKIEEEIILIDRKINTIPTFESVKGLFSEYAKQEEKLRSVRKEKEILLVSLEEIDN
ncbi:DNA sulfur modification protein DndD, partial [Salmonella enterica subsp. enterica serovar Kentucky]|nr:DNA sulfur modification protein DndD [Salmonella enterica subsp. enterica serovar Kentucky]